LGRTSEHRRALFRTMATDLLLHEQIVTTVPKAKELRPYVEKLITKGKDNKLHNIRQVAGILRRADVLKKLFEDIGPRFAERQGGYLRIVRAGFRRGDSAPMAVIELVDRDPTAKGAAAYEGPGQYRYGTKEDEPDDVKG
jgi:large subunit ribosomal protein L17